MDDSSRVSQPLLHIQHISKRLGDRLVLKDVSFDVAQGQVAAFIGPNGAGKSTLLRIIAGVWRPSMGEVDRFGKPIHGDGSDRRIGYLGHQSFLYPALSGLENLEFYARLYGVKPVREAAMQALNAVGMKRFQHEQVRRYSRGMEQRVAIARAFMGDPELVLLDEPYTGLDVQATVLLDRLIRNTLAKGGGALLITHQLDEAKRLADYVGILWQGRLVSWQAREPGVFDDLEQRYQSLFHRGGG